MEYVDKFKVKLQENIGIKRYNHCIRVMNTALDLGKKYKIDEDKIIKAALLHDCAKFSNSELILQKSKELKLKIDKYMDKNIQLIHGPLGSLIAKKDYNISDIDILNAIKYHTTGRENMSLLEKIIYISDYIEPKRNFDGIEEVRKMSLIDLDYSILMSMDRTIKYVVDNNWIIHINTIKGRNYLINDLGKNIMKYN